MRFCALAALCAAFVLGIATAAWADVPVPALRARVTDLTGTLSAEQRRALDADLHGIEARSGNQIAVLMVPTTQPEAIAQYSLRVVEAWQLGRKGKDNGLLLLVAKNDRQVRIEVGYGLEGIIPDAIARRVIDETITPHFKRTDYAGGIAAGVQRLAELIEGRAAAAKSGESAAALSGDDSAANDTTDNARTKGRLIDNIREVPLWLLVALAVAGSALRGLLGPLFGALTMAGAVGAGAWFIAESIGLAIVAAALAFIFVLVGITNWIGIGLGGSSRGGSGGFSGGGGGFGGGGASGRW